MDDIGESTVKDEYGLFYCDYKIVEQYEYPFNYRSMYLHAPIILLYQNESYQKRPLGIRFNVPQIITDNGWKYAQENGKDLTHKIYTPSSKPALWRFAKLHA